MLLYSLYLMELIIKYMFLKIDNIIINLDKVTIISVNKVAQAIWNVKIEAEKGNIIYSKDFKNEKDAHDLGNKFTTLIKPIYLQ